MDKNFAQPSYLHYITSMIIVKFHHVVKIAIGSIKSIKREGVTYSTIQCSAVTVTAVETRGWV